MPDPTLISITPELYESLELLVENARIQLPDELRHAIAESLTRYKEVLIDEAEKPMTDTGSDVVEENPSGQSQSHSSDAPLQEHKEQPSSDPTAYIPHSVLLKLSQWTRLPKPSRAIRRIGIDPHRYSIIALCAGTRTYTTPAQERLIKTDPAAASEFLPSNFTAPPSTSSRPTRSTTSWGSEYRAASKELSAVFNVLFSIGGVGVAVYVVAKTSSGMRQESAILVAFLAALITAIAEIWLYIAYSRRSARRARVGEALRIAETRQAGPSKEHLVRTDEKADEGKQTSSRTEEGGLLEKKEGDDGVLATTKSELTGTVQTSREESGTRTIRLRRRPLGSGMLQDSGTGKVR